MPASTLNITPTYNIWLVGVFAFLGALCLSYERSAELINFGAFLAFMGVNAAVVRQFYFLHQDGHQRSFLADALVPVLGFLFCLVIWLSLPNRAKIIGALWFAVGVTYDGIVTRGFRTPPAMIDLAEF